MEGYFFGFTIKSFRRLRNKEADELAKAAANLSTILADVLYEVQDHKSLMSTREVLYISAIHSDDWRA